MDSQVGHAQSELTDCNSVCMTGSTSSVLRLSDGACCVRSFIYLCSKDRIAAAVVCFCCCLFPLLFLHSFQSNLWSAAKATMMTMGRSSRRLATGTQVVLARDRDACEEEKKPEEKD